VILIAILALKCAKQSIRNGGKHETTCWRSIDWITRVSLLSPSAGVSTASVGNIAANNIARLGVDPSIASGATATAASRISGSVSNNVVFSESRYNDFQNQIKFKENKSSF
jgi:hypothetical protein